MRLHSSPDIPQDSQPNMISITIPVFNEAKNLNELYAEIDQVMIDLGRPYEIIFVNDGSTDGSKSILRDIAKGDPHVKVINFQRNFGQTAAMMAGFDHARGAIIVPMDGDLQNDPRDIPKLLDRLDQGFDVVSGWRKFRKDSLIARKWVSQMANILISYITGVKLHDYGCSLKAYRKNILKDVRLFGEMHRFIPIYASWEGAAITEMEVNHRARTRGKSNYGLTRTYKVLLDLMFIAFMDRYLGKPIYLFGGFGVLNILIAFIAAGTSVYYKFFGEKSFIETPLPTLAAMTFITGTMCILLGFLAEMIIRIYYAIHEKTTYLVADFKNMSVPEEDSNRDVRHHGVHRSG